MIVPILPSFEPCNHGNVFTTELSTVDVLWLGPTLAFTMFFILGMFAGMGCSREVTMDLRGILSTICLSM